MGSRKLGLKVESWKKGTKFLPLENVSSYSCLRLSRIDILSSHLVLNSCILDECFFQSGILLTLYSIEFLGQDLVVQEIGDNLRKFIEVAEP